LDQLPDLSKSPPSRVFISSQGSATRKFKILRITATATAYLIATILPHASNFTFPKLTTMAEYILDQTRRNISFLVSQKTISQSDADLILSKLPADQNPPLTPEAQAPNRQLGTPAVQYARALWGYNEDRQACALFSLLVLILFLKSTTEPRRPLLPCWRRIGNCRRDQRRLVDR
jgi:hypothetical protein